VWRVGRARTEVQVDRGVEGLEVVADYLVEKALFGSAALIDVSSAAGERRTVSSAGRLRCLVQAIAMEDRPSQ
jgi:hypothetical protein